MIIKGEFKIKTSSLETDWIGNLITDGGLLELQSTSNDILSNVSLGDGLVTPDVVDTSLGNQVLTIARTSVTKSLTTTPEFTVSRTAVFTSSPLTSDIIITEIGLGSGSNIFSHALVKDIFKEPVYLEVLSGEIVTVYYRLTYYLGEDRTSQTVSINGTNYALTPMSVEHSVDWASPGLGALNSGNCYLYQTPALNEGEYPSVQVGSGTFSANSDGTLNLYIEGTGAEGNAIVIDSPTGIWQFKIEDSTGDGIIVPNSFVLKINLNINLTRG